MSVGHQQMMTAPMRPLGLSFFQLTAGRPMFKAAGRLFVDVTQALASPATRETILNGLGSSDPLIKDALMAVLDRGDFIKSLPGESPKVLSIAGARNQLKNDPAIASGLIERSRASTEKLKQDIQSKSGPELFDFIQEDILQFRKSFTESQSLAVIMAAMDASAWLNENMKGWLGEKNAADTLSQSAPNNVTSEMGLALLDVADVARRHPQVIDYLQHAKDDDFLDELAKREGGRETRTRSPPTSTSTACDVSGRSTSPTRAGANGRPRSPP